MSLRRWEQPEPLNVQQKAASQLLTIGYYDDDSEGMRIMSCIMELYRTQWTILPTQEEMVKFVHRIYSEHQLTRFLDFYIEGS